MKRYLQQIILPEIGIQGQKNIDAASVFIIGAGGLGNIVAAYLAAMGIGRIGICDFDQIEETNLHRQFLFTANEIGLNKAEVITEKLKLQNRTISIHSFTNKLNERNIEELVKGFQIVCDCSDNAETRMLLDSYCQTNNIPLIHGAVSDWQGYLTVFHSKKKYCLADLFMPDDYFNNQNCSSIGINCALCGIIGSYMVNETLKIALGIDTTLEGKLLYINGLHNHIKILNLKKT